VRVDGRITVSAIMFAVFASFVAMSTTYSPDARLVPLVVGIAGLVLSAFQLLAEIRAARTSQREKQIAGTHARAATLMMWFGAFVLGSVLAGIVAASLLLVFGFLKLQQKERLRTAVGVAVVFATVIYLTFQVALGIPLLEGVLFTFP